ncbi:hypothetical protein FACS1894167_00010 [Synergistales bacterium]|nr:hypothetical protein FACS1894167_00010 [Synergistales bacterium]
MTKENKLFYGDNLGVMRKYIGDETIDLCYIDPPFNSSRNYNRIYNNVGGEDAAQSVAFVDTWTWNDAAEEGLAEIRGNARKLYTLKTMNLANGLLNILERGSLFAYIISLTRRVSEIWRVLKPAGSFYLHCDPTASHYIKMMLDSVFCPRGGEFRNEIVWCYRGARYPKKDFGRRHDLIYRYTKSQACTFNLDEVREEYAPATKKRFAHYIGNKRQGKDFGEQSLHPLGKQPDDWWEVQPIAPSAKERLGYPTQKPEALLERVIRASSNEGDTVLDAYCGCGTTVAVAQRLKRKWIGIDITYQSISLILRRLENTYGVETLEGIELNGIPRDRESAIALANKNDDKTRKEFEKWAVLTYSDNRAMINEKKGSDKGVDGAAFIAGADSSAQKVLFSVKSGKTGVSHVRDLRGTVEREGAAGGILITLSPPTKDMMAEAASAGNMENIASAQKIPKIKIVTVDDILDGERMALPLVFEVVKKARRDKGKNKSLDFG